MPDYGHDLQFGLFPTPNAADHQRTLELAQLADVLGLDLVSVQDHPYQQGYLDTWTLLSVIGARTSSLRVAPNVASLPLRPPVVLAKSVASLDVLTGGRVELGLGAGAFWDAIVAAGGERRTPGEAVSALREAIELIREFWRGGTVRFEGEHYRAKGLHAGPQPAHDVPIWVGSYKPRMLRLTGELADAWIPSMGYADPPALADLNAVIDEATVSAGRSPDAVRRMYNVFGAFGTGGGFLQGTPADWAEQLAELTLTEGMSSYVLGTDDPDDLRRWAEEVASDVRERVEAARAGTPTPAATPAPSVPSASDAVPWQVLPTPDDGTRLTGDLPWDEAARPTLAEPGDASYPLERQAVAQHLLDIHDHLRSELVQVRDIVGQVRRGLASVGAARSSINTMTLRQNNWTLGAYCESYCRIVNGHHTLEDTGVFPHLRRSEPDVGPVIDRLHEEHEVIHGVLDQVDRALVALVEQGESGHGSASLDALEHAVDLLTDTLLSHLSYEERELRGPLARHGFY